MAKNSPVTNVSCVRDWVSKPQLDWKKQSCLTVFTLILLRMLILLVAHPDGHKIDVSLLCSGVAVVTGLNLINEIM